MLAWLKANPDWGVWMVFLVSFAESVVLVGLLLPGIVILFGIGTLIGLGALDIWPVWVAAFVGAVLGDGLSFALGHRYREHLLELWPFSRYPSVMQRGFQFFQEHGAKSVVAGRFIGPLRPIIPAVAGIMGMVPARFATIDLLAAFFWVPAFLLPGMLFGASLEVASEYTGRLTLLIVSVLVVLWLIWRLMRLVYEPLASRSARWLRHGIRWAYRHPVLGRITGPLLDPSQPEVLSVSMLGVLLVVIIWSLVLLLFLAPFTSQPQLLDQAVASYALSLRNNLADAVMVSIAQLSRWQVMLIPSAAVGIWLLAIRRYNAAAHWLVAIGGGWLLQSLLAWGLRTAPQVMELPEHAFRSPSTAVSLITVVLSFFAVMIAREVKRKHRQWPYLAAGLILAMLLCARLYLGLEWLSGALLGVLLGLAWTVIVGIGYRLRAFDPFSGAHAGLIFYTAIAVVFSWQVSVNAARETVALQTSVITKPMPADSWWNGAWAELPASRTGAYFAEQRRFNVQLAVEPDRVARDLSGAGWQPAAANDWRWVLQALNPKPDAASLPLQARAFEGHSEVLVMQKQDAVGGELVTVRMWDSGVRLNPDGQALYLAQVAREELVQRLWLFSYWRSQPLGAADTQAVMDAVEGLERKTVGDSLLLLRETPQGSGVSTNQSD